MSGCFFDQCIHATSLPIFLQISIHQKLAELKRTVGKQAQCKGKVGHDKHFDLNRQRLGFGISDRREQNDRVVERVKQTHLGQQMQTQGAQQQQCENQKRYLQQTSHSQTSLYIVNRNGQMLDVDGEVCQL